MAQKSIFKVIPKKSAYVIESPLLTIEIPSKEYPLHLNFNTKIKVFRDSNTKEITDARILELINKQQPRLGYCYDNIEKFVADCKVAGITVQPYSGWLFVGGSNKVVHHAWAVIEGKHVVDLSIDLGDFELLADLVENETPADKVKITELIVASRLTREELPLTERCVAGNTSSYLLYVGTASTSEQARKVYQSLNRPAKPNGTPAQQLYYKKKHTR